MQKQPQNGQPPNAVSSPPCCGAANPGAAGGHEHAGEQVSHSSAKTDAAEARDPVCGMKVRIEGAKHTHVHGDETYYFCSEGCRARFAADPQRYLESGKEGPHGGAPRPGGSAAAEGASPPSSPAPAPSFPAGVVGAFSALAAWFKPPAPGAVGPASVTYTCPMHPEVVRQGPGDCPICGMALEPRQPTAAAPGPSPELLDLLFRLKIGAVLTVPLLIVAMGGHLGFIPHAWLAPRTAQWLEFLLAAPVVLWCGYPFLRRGLASLQNRSPNMWTLILLGVGAAFLYSVVAVVAPWAFPPALVSAHGTVGLYFEAAAVIIVLVLAGQVMELKARERTGGAIRALLNLAPKTARRVEADGSEHEVALETVKKGDRLRVRPGEAVPVDGTVAEGHSAIDEHLLSGEPVPVEKGPGDAVTGGTLNTTGTFIMEAEHVGADTVLARIVALVAEAQRSRAPSQNLADAVAGWFVPAVTVVAALAFFGWLIFGPEPPLAYAIAAAVSVLIIACPCALGLATPMTVMVATGRGAREGILVRNAEALETLARATALVVDKTGTLTEGKPRLTDVLPLPGFEADEVVRLAAGLEAGSEHPLAAAVLAGARERGIVPPKAGAFKAIHGQGIEGEVEGRRVVLGTRRLMDAHNVSLEGHENTARQLAAQGKTVLYAAAGGRLAGFLAVADPIKPSARPALKALAAHRIEVVMATGDRPETARAVARELGLGRVHAGMLPAEKARLVSDLKARGRVVAFAGDGVNDAPALASAHTGIAMGTGADVAIESAGITLPKGDLAGIVRARLLAEAARANIRQNLALAFGYNVIAIPVAAGVLYPVFGVLLSPMIAALAMSLSSVSVIANALRLDTVRLALPDGGVQSSPRQEEA